MAELYTYDDSVISGYVEFGEYKIPLPKMPPKTQMVNYGLPIKEQKFRHTEIPKSLLQRKNRVTKEEEKFIQDEWHKRKNGVWILIKGEPVFITGSYYFFLNYWWTKKLIHPDFRYVQCQIFLLWNMIVRDPHCYGLFLIGPRRIGKTEFTLGEEYEYITRVRNTQGHNQSKNDTEAYKNFKRITRANKKMIWFMKPIHKGSEDPEEKLEFNYPPKSLTDKQLRESAQSGFEEENIYSEVELGSKIDYEPSKESAYDGQETNRGILNEAGKLENMSLIKWWEVFKPTLHYFDGKEIVGKAWVESSIEEVDDNQIEEVNTFWKDANPNERNENGRTTNGMYRVFVSNEDGAEPDEYGFPKRDEAKQHLENEIENLKKKGKHKEIAALLRKSPRTVEDALTPSGATSAFNKERLQDILKRLDFPDSFGFDNKPRTIKGNFIWANGAIDTKVVFIEDDQNGKWEVSQLLKDGKDNAYVTMGGIRYPGNLREYRGGCDPYEHDEVVDINRASKGAAIMMRMYDDNEDGAKKTEDGFPLDYGWEWKTKQPVADYLAREDDPAVFFEDMLMMHVYYGTQMHLENNKGSIKKYFRDRGYGEYLMKRVESTYEDKGYTSRSGEQTGTPATEETINQYFMAIAHYVMNYSNAIKHRRLIIDLLSMNRNKKVRTKRDISVSFGWSLLACEKQYLRIPMESSYEEEKDNWFTYQTA